MKKIIFGLTLILLGVFAQAQNGLENIVVEKYYISNAADAAGSIGHGTLPVGSVTYRFYADMLPGYNFQMAYGNVNHSLTFTTTTSFYNSTDYGSNTPGFSKSNAQKWTTMLDSWLSVGGACAGNLGVLKSEDDGLNNAVNAHGLLLNNDPKMGIPLTTQDGFLAGTPQAVTMVGITTQADVFGDGSANGNSFILNGQAWSSLSGSVGPTAANRVLIAQITTDGILTYALNIQIGTPLGGVEVYVSSNPLTPNGNGQNEIMLPSLTGTLNAAPTVSITLPADSAHTITGDVVVIDANAAYVSGTVKQVEFKVDGITIDIDSVSPYSVNYTGVTGTHILTAIAMGNDSTTKTSLPITLFVAPNQAPAVSITAPASGTPYYAPAAVTINVSASDIDGTIKNVEFFVNNVSIGIDSVSPYSINWTSVIGNASITAKATDDRNAFTVSAPVSLTIADPNVHYKVVSVTNSCQTSIFSIPVTAIDTVSNVIGYDIVLNYNSSDIAPTGIITKTSNLINSSYYDISSFIDAPNSKINISILVNGNAPVGSTFHGVGNLFNVEFYKTSNFSAVDTTIVSVSSLQESYAIGVALKACDPGKYISFKNEIFKGVLQFWNGYIPIQYNASNPNQYAITNIIGIDSACNITSAPLVQPDTSGNFNYNIINGSSISINRDINDTVTMMPVLSSFDVFLAKKVVTSDPSFIPNVYQIWAMDVNMDGVISAGDVSQLSQRIVKKIPEFKQAWNYDINGNSLGIGASKDWRFVDNSRVNNSASYSVSSTYPANDGIGFSKSLVPQIPLCLNVPSFDNSGCPQILNEIYQGILLGDIDGSYRTFTANGTIKSSQNLNDTVIFDLTDATITSKYIDIPVSIKSSDNVNGFDFSTKFNETKFKYDTVINLTTYLDGYSNFNTIDRTIRYTATSLIPGGSIQTGNTLVLIRLSKLDGQINFNDLYSTDAYINGNKAIIKLFKQSLGISNINNDQRVIVYPNPASDKLFIEVSENSKVQLFDINGKEVVLERNISANQLQTMDISNVSKGVYLIKVLNDKFVKIQKIIINN